MSIRLTAILCSFACLAAHAAPVVYPAKGQSPAQTDHDKFACFEWSKTQSGFDPMQAQTALPPSAAPGTTTGGTDAATGSMVRGAAGGAAIAELADRDAGKGAAAGLLGAAMRDRIRQQQQQQARQQQAAQQQQAQAGRVEQQRSTFNRAFGACMEARGYVVK